MRHEYSKKGPLNKGLNHEALFIKLTVLDGYDWFKPVLYYDENLSIEVGCYTSYEEFLNYANR